MKKLTMLAVPVILFGVILMGTPATAQTASDWSVKLTFSTAKTADLLPITLGESASAIEIMKPPPMPGLSVTSNPDDAIVNAYVKTASKKIAENLLAPDASLPGRVWAVEVNAEEASTQVTVTADLSKINPGATLSIIDPASGARKTITQSNVPTPVFTTGATTGPKTLYVMVGTTNTFAVANAGTRVGGVDVPRLDPAADKSGINILLNGTVKATTAADGSFTAAGISPGTYAVKVKGDHLISSNGTLTVAADGTAAVALPEPAAGDINNDGMIDSDDFLVLRRCYGKTQLDPPGTIGGCVNADDLKYANLNGDAAKEVDSDDFLILRVNYGKSETP